MHTPLTKGNIPSRSIEEPNSLKPNLFILISLVEQLTSETSHVSNTQI